MKRLFCLIVIFLCLYGICCAKNNHNIAYVKVSHIGISDKSIENLFIAVRNAKLKPDGNSNLIFTDKETFNTVSYFVSNYVHKKNFGIPKYHEYGSFNIAIYNEKGMIMKNYDLKYRMESKAYFVDLINKLRKKNLDKTTINGLNRLLIRINY